jgi:hypothetical protein
MALLLLIRNGVVSLFAMVLAPSSSWRCHPCCNGIFVIINAQIFLPSSQWCCCLCHNGIVVIDVQASLLSL